MSHLRFVFGTPHGTGWYDSIFPLAAKCSLTLEAFGEEIEYLQHLSRCGTDKMCRGMVFGPRHFYLLTCHDGTITSRTIGHWIQPGTGPLIRNFFSVESPWEAAVRVFCVKLGLEPTKQLGIGGTARVIEVRQKSDGECWALKVVLTSTVNSLAIEQEYLDQLIVHASSTPALSSILPIKISPLHKAWDKKEQATAAAILLQPIGVPLDGKEVLSKPDVFCQILLHLRTLHQHGVCHGDPRIPNLLRLASPVRRAPPRAAAAAASSSSTPLTQDPLSAKATDTYFWVDFMQRDPMSVFHLRERPPMTPFFASVSASTTSASLSLMTSPALPSSSAASSGNESASPNDRLFQIHQDVHRFVDSFTGQQHQRGPILTRLLIEYDAQLHVAAAEFRPLADQFLAFIKRMSADPRAASADL
jgi:hypothetical protein